MAIKNDDDVIVIQRQITSYKEINKTLSIMPEMLAGQHAVRIIVMEEMMIFANP
jgi:hypothetical protein